MFSVVRQFCNLSGMDSQMLRLFYCCEVSEPLLSHLLHGHFPGGYDIEILTVMSERIIEFFVKFLYHTQIQLLVWCADEGSPARKWHEHFTFTVAQTLRQWTQNIARWEFWWDWLLKFLSVIEAYSCYICSDLSCDWAVWVWTFVHAITECWNVPNNRFVGKRISLTVLISSSTGEESVQDIGNLAIRGSEWTDHNTISWMKSNILAYCNNNDN